MIKLRGFGGESEFSGPQPRILLPSMAGLAAVTSRIKLWATGADARHPAGDRGPHGARRSI